MKTRITRINPVLRGDIEALLDAAAMYPPRPRTQADFDTPPRDRRERDGEAFDVPPVRFGGGLVWGEGERPPRDWPEILGSIAGAAIVVGVALFLGWLAARGLR